jgi:hypothetical protein
MTVVQYLFGIALDKVRRVKKAQLESFVLPLGGVRGGRLPFG